jgi:uncharacterized membrane protein
MQTAIAAVSLLLAACSGPVPVASVLESVQPSASVATGKRSPGDVGPPLQVVRVFGNEPFWNVHVEGGTLTCSTPDDPAGIVLRGRRRSVPGGVEIAGSRDGKPFVLTLIEGECSDGMSGSNYALSARLSFGDIDFSGCGEAAK